MLKMHLGEGCAVGHPVPPDAYGHWCLTHFLLAGHHKLEATAVEQKAVQLLTLLSIDQSRVTPERLDQLEEILSREPSYRSTGSPPTGWHGEGLFVDLIPQTSCGRRRLKWDRRRLRLPERCLGR
jgi:hypothetical protein